MLTYGAIEVIQLGPIPIHMWGLFVAIGFAAATWWAARRAPAAGINPEHVLDAAWRILIAAFVGARLAYVAFYAPAYYVMHPADIIRVWEGGLSSFGGIVGAVAVGVWFMRSRRIPMRAFTDVVSTALPIGFAIGRIGCHFTRMHPGPPCSGPLCATFPDGVTRLDLGLTESVVWAAIAVALHTGGRRIGWNGWRTVLVAGGYGVIRFLLDALRVADARYLGLTPAQYGSIALVLIAAMLAVRLRRAHVPVVVPAQ